MEYCVHAVSILERDVVVAGMLVSCKLGRIDDRIEVTIPRSADGHVLSVLVIQSFVKR